MPQRFLPALLCCLVAVACTNQGSGCSGFETYDQGTYAGPKMDSAGAVRIGAGGFAELNARAPEILAALAPDGGALTVPIACSLQDLVLVAPVADKLAIADQGSAGCTSETCGRLDGKCDGKDAPAEATLVISSLSFAPAAPNVIEATVVATVKTGKLLISSVSKNPVVCLLAGGGPMQCGLDFDTARANPAQNDMAIRISLSIDQKWDKLLKLEVREIGGALACGATGASPAPKCIDPDDIAISIEGTKCTSVCDLLDSDLVKQTIIGKLTDSLITEINTALGEANCAPCRADGTCPTSPSATAMCVVDGDAGVCVDSATGVCVPKLLGLEGKLDVSAIPEQPKQLELAIGAGGLSAADSVGATIGLRGGAKEVSVSSCVPPATAPVAANLPLPNFELDAPTSYDVALSVSSSMLNEMFFRVQQSGALCIDATYPDIPDLHTGPLLPVLSSLGLYTEKMPSPMRIAVRPTKPPTAQVGPGSFSISGAPLVPLLRVLWPALEIDLYATIDDRFVRVFTLSMDLDLPLWIKPTCGGFQPVLGKLMNAVSNVTVKNNELLDEDPTVITQLMPQIIAALEPQLADALPTIDLPPVDALNARVQLVAAKGVGNISGTQSYNHLGLYTDLLAADAGCP